MTISINLTDLENKYCQEHDTLEYHDDEYGNHCSRHIDIEDLLIHLIKRIQILEDKSFKEVRV